MYSIDIKIRIIIDMCLFQSAAITSVGNGADPGFLAVNPQVT